MANRVLGYKLKTDEELYTKTSVADDFEKFDAAADKKADIVPEDLLADSAIAVAIVDEFPTPEDDALSKFTDNEDYDYSYLNRTEKSGILVTARPDEIKADASTGYCIAFIDPRTFKSTHVDEWNVDTEEGVPAGTEARDILWFIEDNIIEAPLLIPELRQTLQIAINDFLTDLGLPLSDNPYPLPVESVTATIEFSPSNAGSTFGEDGKTVVKDGVIVRVTFSEAVSGFAIGDITTGGFGAAIIAMSGGGTVFDIAIAIGTGVQGSFDVDVTGQVQVGGVDVDVTADALTVDYNVP